MPGPQGPIGGTVPTNGLVAHYRGDGIDLSGNGNNLTNNGVVTLSADRFGVPSMAGSYNGTNYYELVNHPLVPVGASPRTVSLWVRCASTTVSQAVINWGSATQGHRFGLVVLPTGQGGVDYFVGEGQDMMGTKAIGNNVWHHVVITFDGTAVTNWVDGFYSNSLARALDTTTPNLEIGRSAFDHTPEPFVGAIDDVRIYNRVLTGAERGALYFENGYH